MRIGNVNTYWTFYIKKITFKCDNDVVMLKPLSLDFPGGSVVKNVPASAGDTGASPGPGRSHMPWSN